MREEVAFRIRAFRQVLEEASRELPEELRGEPGKRSRWSELKNFPAGSCDLASNCLAQYLKDSKVCGEKGEPCILFMYGTQPFHKAENSTVQAHVIVMLHGDYIDMTLDQFEEYTDYIPAEPVETGGVLGTLLRKIPQYEGEIETRRINLDRLGKIYAWLRDRADAILTADPEWQAREQSMAEARQAAKRSFSFSSTTPQTGTGAPGGDK
ncbi:hypothetical protein EIR35_23940 [Salmonella enterica]|uniref:Uncharacterized protein n=1 Tax=Salmonella potsdam TaxID=597 RepID=A0A5X0KMG5_SALPO|nr:hypothetical protein [Citrobacter freundii]EAU7106561.1 hypothetical protein [Salmonella enterica]EBY7662272.1 hypothetical protein [Salmonella enterica subsp. enterica serovar Potsdam]MBJ5182600.1 hypothetical protein [Salmonella enterica subsp. enterica serovar Weltevreden]MGD55703.1 hypothetical protein [Salmonella enterica]